MILRTIKICIILCCLISCMPAIAQSPQEIQLAYGMMDKSTPVQTHGYAKSATNEFQMLFSGLFIGYKALVSSQDAGACSFTPSCSEYGMMAVQKKGAFLGVISTFDRLTRCNGQSPEKYERDPATGLLIDPVK